MQESQCVIQKTKHSFVGHCFFQAKCHSPGDLRRANCRWLHKHGIHLFSRATPQCGSCNHSIFSESQVCCLFFGPRANNTSSFADSCSLNNVLFEPRIGSPSWRSGNSMHAGGAVAVGTAESACNNSLQSALVGFWVFTTLNDTCNCSDVYSSVFCRK